MTGLPPANSCQVTRTPSGRAATDGMKAWLAGSERVIGGPKAGPGEAREPSQGAGVRSERAASAWERSGPASGVEGDWVQPVRRSARRRFMGREYEISGAEAGA